MGRPTTLAALLALKRAHPDLRIVGGNTEVGIEVKFKAARYRHLAAPTHIPELTRLEARTCRARRAGTAPLDCLEPAHCSYGTRSAVHRPARTRLGACRQLGGLRLEACAGAGARRRAASQWAWAGLSVSRRPWAKF